MSEDPYLRWLRIQATRPRYILGVPQPVLEFEDDDRERDRSLDKETDTTGTDLDY